MANFTRRTFIASVTAGVAAARSFPAVAADEAAMLAAAKREGRVVLYSNADPSATERTLRAFTAKYGVDADFQRLTGASLAQRFSAEYDTNNHIADLFISSDPIFPKDAVKKGVLTRADDLPAMNSWPRTGYVDGLVPVNVNPYVLAWNTQMVPGGLKSFEELNEAKLRGKVLIGDPRVLASARLWYVAVLQKYGEGFLRDLGKHANYSPSVVPGLQQLAAGSMAAYAPTILLAVNEIIDKGAPIAITAAEPVVISQSLASVPAKAPRPNAGRLLLNFWMTREGQEIYSRNSYTLLPGVPGTRMLTDYVDIEPEAGERELRRINSLLGIG